MESIRTRIISTPRLEHWSEDMNFAITLALLLLDERMKQLELSIGTLWVVNNTGTIYIEALDNKWEEQMR